MLVAVLAAITTPFVSLVLQARDIDAYVLLDLRELTVNKVRSKNAFVSFLSTTKIVSSSYSGTN